MAHRSGLGSRRGLLGTGAAIAIAGSLVGGCVGYHSYPPTPEQRARAGMGERAPTDVMVLALQRVITLHPPEDVGGRAFAVNLPVTTPPDVYGMVAERVGGQPLTRDAEGLPVYHIARVWVRNSRAWVDVIWPAPGGEDRSSTVWLEGGLQPWRVTRVQEWNPGVIPTPEPYYIMLNPTYTEPAPTGQ